MSRWLNDPYLKTTYLWPYLDKIKILRVIFCKCSHRDTHSFFASLTLYTKKVKNRPIQIQFERTGYFSVDPDTTKYNKIKFP